MRAECNIEFAFDMPVFRFQDTNHRQARSIEDEIVSTCGGAAFIKVVASSSECHKGFTASFKCTAIDEISMAMPSLNKFIELAGKHEVDPYQAIGRLKDMRKLDQWIENGFALISDKGQALKHLRAFPRIALRAGHYTSKPDQKTFVHDSAQMEDRIVRLFAEMFGWSLREAEIPHWQPTVHSVTAIDIATVRDYLFFEFVQSRLSSNYVALQKSNLTSDEISDCERRHAAALSVLARTNP